MDNLSDIKEYLENAKNNIEGIDLSEIEYAVEEAESAVSNMRSYVNDAMSSVEEASYNTANALDEIKNTDIDTTRLLKLAYRDIDNLLKEGFDTNVQECEMAGVKDTIKEIEEFVGKENLTNE